MPDEFVDKPNSNSGDVTTFCYHCVEYIKLDTCAKFYDHNNKVMMGDPHAPPPPTTITDGSKKAHVKLG